MKRRLKAISDILPQKPLKGFPRQSKVNFTLMAKLPNQFGRYVPSTASEAKGSIERVSCLPCRTDRGAAGQRQCEVSGAGMTKTPRSRFVSQHLNCPISGFCTCRVP
jgi:hypothetical protein